MRIISSKKYKVITLSDYIYKNNINVTICKVDTEITDYLVIKGLYKYLESQYIDFLFSNIKIIL